jgi:hypothetical protein
LIIPRLFFSVVLSSALSFAAADAAVAQSLGDSYSALNFGWSSGYMGLGGNLGRAIEHRHSKRTQPIKSVKAPRGELHAARQRARPQPTSYKPTRDTPVYLIAQSLDNSGLMINTLPPQHFP